jgi:serine/threonine protein kinase
MSEGTQVEDLFHRARQIGNARERELFLAQACGPDSALRRRLERLLAADQRAGAFMEAGAAELRELAPQPEGTRVAGYRLLELIGEGGFGEVWMAEQLEPVKRKVALKLLKLGMDSKAVVARFEAERQALALMEHPAIAKVFDAGLTDNGRPFFAMELVKGVPITVFCDEARLPIRRRLELFATTCRALQHAHHKGVIHRDVKPSNVLVTLADGAPAPKVIDFGIAKAAGAELTDKTLLTGFHQVLGTPEYMAPEQTALGGVDIDTRADVYSLGVLLYELLTGAKPLDLRAALERGYDEVLRVVREEAPPRPSTRASSARDETQSAARLRALEPREFAATLSGDLDWIVLKALEKDRTRRYDTASALADDVERYLRDEAVLARPPSTAYQLSRFVRRHRWQVAAAGALALALIGGIAASTHFALRAEERRAEAESARAAADARGAEALAAAERATRAEQQAQARAAELEQVAAFQEHQLERVDAESMGLRLVEAVREQRRAALARGGLDAEQLDAQLAGLERELRPTNWTSIAVEALARSILEPSQRAVDEQFDEQPLLRASLLESLARSQVNLGRFEAAAALRDQALALCERELGASHPTTLRARLERLRSERAAPDSERVAAELTALAADARERFGADHELELEARAALATLKTRARDQAGALEQFQSVVETWRRLGAADDERALEAQANVGATLLLLGRAAEGAAELEAAQTGYRRAFGPRHRQVLAIAHSLGAAHMSLGRVEDALNGLRAALESARQVYGDDHTVTLGLMDNLAGNLLNAGQAAQAEPLFTELVERLRRVPGQGDIELHHALARLGRLRSAQRRFDDAVVALSEAYTGLDERLEDSDPVLTSCGHNLGTALFNVRRFAEAEPILRRTHAARRATLGPAHQDTATTAQALGSALHGLGRLDEAAEVYGAALEALESSLGAEHERVVRGWRNLGVIAVARRRFDEAAAAYTRCSDAARRARAPELAQDLEVLAVCRLELSDWPGAEAAARECAALREAQAGEPEWNRAYARVLAAAAVLGAGRESEGATLLASAGEQLAQAQDAPKPRPGQPDRVRAACERLSSCFEALHARDSAAGHAASAAQWRQRAEARRPK